MERTLQIRWRVERCSENHLRCLVDLVLGYVLQLCQTKQRLEVSVKRKENNTKQWEEGRKREKSCFSERSDRSSTGGCRLAAVDKAQAWKLWWSILICIYWMNFLEVFLTMVIRTRRCCKYLLHWFFYINGL